MSSSRSRTRNLAEKSGQLKSHSASTSSGKVNKKHAVEEHRVKSSPSERGSGKLGVQDILNRCQESDYRRVFEVNLNGQGLDHLPDLSEFTKLKIIDLGCNKLKQVSPKDLEKNVDLRELKLYGNKLTEISGLDRCKELSNLQLQHNKIKCIGKGLQHVRKLCFMRLDSNCLSKIEPREIACCSQLTVLDISCNSLTDISALNALPALEELDVSNNKIRKIADLGRCKKIQELDISRNQVSDLSGLKGLPCLAVLRAENNQLTSLESLGRTRQLQELYLSNNSLLEVKSFVGQFPSLEILDVSSNALSSPEEMFFLSEISTLLELTLIGNPFDSEDLFSCHRKIVQKIPQLEFLDKSPSQPFLLGLHELPLVTASLPEHNIPLPQVSIKRPSTGHSGAPPTMRPMSASQVLSARQVEEQIKAAELEQTSFEASIASRFSIVKDLFDSLPVELSTEPDSPQVPPPGTAIGESMGLPRPATAEEERPSSRCSSRSRIAQARAFAAEHFHPEQN